MLLKFFLLNLLFFLNTSAQEIKIYGSSARTLSIDPQKARSVTLSQLFAEVGFIPLETTKESLFGNIDQFKIVDKHYVIF